MDATICYVRLPVIYCYLNERRKHPNMRNISASEMANNWQSDPRWNGVQRPYSSEDVIKLRGSIQVEHTLARLGAERLWWLLHHESYVPARSALSRATRQFSKCRPG